MLTKAASIINKPVVGLENILIFRLHDHFYAFPIAPIHQIIEMVKITAVPQLDGIMEGVVNFHGSILPLISLSKHFSLVEEPRGLQTPILIVDLPQGLVGLIVDEVLEVREISTSQFIKPQQLIPDLIGETSMIDNLIENKEGTIFHLNIDQLFDQEQSALLANTIESLSRKIKEDGLIPSSLVEDPH